MRQLIIGDIHITKDSISELKEIREELLSIADREEIDEVIQLGDLYDSTSLSREVLCFGTSFITQLAKDRSIILLQGNHGATNDTTNIVDYLCCFPNCMVIPDYVNYNIYYGHCLTDKSLFPTKVINDDRVYTKSCEYLSKYDICLIGHQHSPQKISDNIYHLGSIRYVSFGEVKDEYKQVAILDINIDDINNIKQDIKFIPLSSPIKMIDVSSIEELSKIPTRTKVRYLINSFKQFKNEINIINRLKTKFYSFQLKLNFTKEEFNSFKKKEHVSIIDSIYSWLDKIEDEDVKKELKTIITEEFK